jgi:hypothetical protein
VYPAGAGHVRVPSMPTPNVVSHIESDVATPEGAQEQQLWPRQMTVVNLLASGFWYSAKLNPFLDWPWINQFFESWFQIKNFCVKLGPWTWLSKLLPSNKFYDFLNFLCFFENIKIYKMRICGAKLQNVGPRFFYNFLKLVKTENGQSLFRLPRFVWTPKVFL